MNSKHESLGMDSKEVSEAYQEINKMPIIPLENSDVRKLLESYNQNRQAIDVILSHLQQEADGELYPSPSTYDSAKVLKTFDTWETAEGLLERCKESRVYYQKTLEQLICLTELLDKLMYQITRLKSRHRTVIIDTYFGFKDDSEIAADLLLSESSVQKYRSQAIQIITERMNRMSHTKQEIT